MVFDPVGGVQLREAINCAKPPTWAGTRILLLGFAGEYEDESTRNRISTRLTLAKQLHLIGVGTGLRPERMEKVLELCESGWMPKPFISHSL